MANRIPYNIKPPAGTPLNTAHPSVVGLSHFFPMWENGGSKVADLVNPDYFLGLNELASASDIYWSTSIYGPVLRRDPANGGGGGLLANTSFTFSATWSWDAWILTNGKPGSSFYQNLFSVGSTNGLWINNTAGTYVLDFYSGADNNDTTDLGTGKWHHVAVTHNGGGTPINYYVDGKLSSSTANRTFSAAADALLQDAGGSPAEGFNGMCLYQRFWNRVITPQEVAQLYVQPFGMFQKPRRRNITDTTESTRTRTAVPRYRRYSQTKPPVGTQINKGDALSQGLVGYWPFNENGGTKPNDLSGNNNIGSFSGSAIWGSGRGGPAVKLDYLNSSYVNVASSRNTGFTTAYTLSGWFYANSSKVFNIMLIRGDGDINDIEFYSGSGTQGITVVHNRGNGGTLAYSGNDIGSSFTVGAWGDIPSGTWYHIAVTYAGTTLRVYINGVLKGTATGGVDPLNTTSRWRIGSGGTATYGPSGAAFFDGTINDILLHNRALTPTEIIRLYAQPFSPFTPIRLRRPASSGAAAASTFFFRKTLSAIGTKVGSRQLHGVN